LAAAWLGLVVAGCVTSESSFDGVEGITPVPAYEASVTDVQPHDGGEDAEAQADDGPADAGEEPSADVQEEPAPTCTAQVLCPDGKNIGNISADTQAQKVTVDGTVSEWLLVRALEDDSGLTAVDLSVRFTLNSPPDANFDLYVYMAGTAQQTDIECATLTKSSTNATGSDVVLLTWPDKQGLGGQEDGRNISVEIRWVSGACPPASGWSLLVEGNQ